MPKPTSGRHSKFPKVNREPLLEDLLEPEEPDAPGSGVDLKIQSTTKEPEAAPVEDVEEDEDDPILDLSEEEFAALRVDVIVDWAGQDPDRWAYARDVEGRHRGRVTVMDGGPDSK